MSDTTKLQPDASGTVVLSGYEDMALSFDLKHSYMEKLQAEVDSIKDQLRDLASTTLKRVEGEAKRIFFRNGKKGGVSVSLPDFESKGNRLVLSEKKMGQLAKMAPLDSIGLPVDALFEEEVTDPGGEVIELRGSYVEWFKQHYAAQLSSGSPDLKYEKRDRTVSRRLKVGAIALLRQAAAAGNDLADALLSAGTKSFIIKPER